MNYDVVKRRAQRTALTWPKAYAKARKKRWLATRAETEERLAEDWRLSQAIRTKAPGTVAAKRLREMMAEKLQEVRDLLDLEVILHVTPSMEERTDMLDTMERLASAPIPHDDDDRVYADPPKPKEEPAPEAPPPSEPGALRRALNWLSGGT